MFKIIHTSGLLNPVYLLNNQYQMICFSGCFLTILVSLPNLRERPLEYFPKRICQSLNMGQVGWFLSHHSHQQFLRHVLHRKHVKTLSKPFKDSGMMILEPFLHDIGRYFYYCPANTSS